MYRLAVVGFVLRNCILGGRTTEEGVWLRDAVGRSPGLACSWPGPRPGGLRDQAVIFTCYCFQRGLLGRGFQGENRPGEFPLPGCVRRERVEAGQETGPGPDPGWSRVSLLRKPEVVLERDVSSKWNSAGGSYYKKQYGFVAEHKQNASTRIRQDVKHLDRYYGA